MATLVADRYPDDEQQQIRVAITSFDGFGRALQSKQRVESAWPMSSMPRATWY
ncbi:hypothetical protein QZH46_19135 [Pseudomonas corrugata]